jgi:hypothetical protein
MDENCRDAGVILAHTSAQIHSAGYASSTRVMHHAHHSNAHQADRNIVSRNRAETEAREVEMPLDKDPTRALRKAAGGLPDVVQAMSCNQTSYKTGKVAFLFVGPGLKGVGFKAMFKLEASRVEAERLAKSEPDRYQVGIGNWVTTRFSTEVPLPRKIWSRWLRESYAGTTKS